MESAASECLQCTLEAETVRRNKEAEHEQEKLKRKEPLSDPVVRQFYTRTRGVPTQATRSDKRCPLEDGRYYVLTRAWCHGWRRYIKSGGEMEYNAPDGTSLTCDAHQLFLIPPHLEHFLNGHASQLLNNLVPSPASPPASPSPARRIPVGVMDEASVQALYAAGMTAAEVHMQLNAMRSLERDAAAEAQPMELDRGNHAVVEILTADEYQALERWWPDFYTLSFTVKGNQVNYGTETCRDCDATARQCALSIKNRQRGW
jgi:hypothetical protein